MAQMINVCGTTIELSKVKDICLVKRDCIFYPAYQETEEQTTSVFAKFGATQKKKFEFVKMVPFGVLLTEREIPSGINHEIKGFGEENGTNIFEKIIHAVVKPVGDTANTTVDLVGIDTSGNREFRVLTQGRRIANIRLRDVAAKVRFLSGKVSDVYINDSIYKFLGEPIAPAIVPIETLVIKIERAIHAFFGEGFDLDDAQAVYKSIFEEYKQFQAEQKNAKPNLVMPKLNLAMPKLNLQLPKQNMPTIKMQSPFVIRKNESVKEYAEGSSQEVSVDDEVMREFGENK